MLMMGKRERERTRVATRCENDMFGAVEFFEV
jgi:hypothetical protein